MLATLFFDEAKANTSVLVRQRPSADDDDNNTASLVPYEEGSVSRYDDSQLRVTAGRWAGSTTYVPPLHVPAYVYQSFTCHGSESIPELHATLFWWLDDGRDAKAPVGASTASPQPSAPLLVHLMLVDDSESAREAHHSQSRMLSVELPVVGGRQQLLTCGVSRLAVGGHCVAVAWMSRDLHAGFVRITMQRSVNRASTLLLTAQGGVVQAEPLDHLQRTFRGEVLRIVEAHKASASRAVVQSSQAGAAAAASEFSAEHWMLVSGCVLASVPVEERRAMAFFVLTSGVSVWRVQLYEDGSTVLASLVDPKHRHDTAVLLGRQLASDNALDLLDEFDDVVTTGAAAAGEGGAGDRPAASSSSPTSRPDGARSHWLARWVRGDGQRGGTVVPRDLSEDDANRRAAASSIRRYLTVSAVSGSSLLTLVRCSGHVEILSAEFDLVERYAVCRLPAEQARSLHRAARTTEVVQQWASLDPTGRCVHMLTCLGTQDNRRCIRSMVPAVEPNTENKLAVAVQCSYGLTPPTTMSSPISAAVDATGRRLLVLWDTGVEEDAHLENVHSTMSLADASSTGRARCLAQLIETELTPLGALALRRTSTFICHGAGAVQAALAQENSFVVVNKFKASHAAYVLQPTIHPLSELVEGTLIGNDNENDAMAWPTAAVPTPTASGLRTAAALCFVPAVETHVALVEAEGAAATASPYEAFCEGMAVLNASPQSANLLATLLHNLFTLLTPQTQLASVPHIISEAYLSGYTPSVEVSSASVEAAVQLARTAQFTRDAVSDRLGPLLEGTPYSLFCRFGRLYLQQRITHDLRQRIVFVAVTILGEAGSRAGTFGDHTGTTTTTAASAQLVATLTQLLAAYHAAVVAGPELTNMLDAVHEDVVEALLSLLLFPNHDAVTPSRVAVRVAARLARCHTSRCMKACLTWCVLLKPLCPILYHFDAVLDMEVGRTAHSTHIQAATRRVAEALAQLPVQEVLDVLVEDGLLLTDRHNATCFSGVPEREVRQLLHAHPSMGPKLYVAGLLRRATPNGSLQSALAEPVVRSFFLTELYQVWRVVRAANRCPASSEAGEVHSPPSSSIPPSGESVDGGFAVLKLVSFPILQLALEELRIDTLFCLSLACLDRGAVSVCFHDLQSALDAARQLGVGNAYADVVRHVVHQAVQVACASPVGVHALTVASIESPQLRDLVVHRWYNYIARLPTKSASAATEARRFRAIMGLHRFLLNQHAYAQCGRVMTDLATLLRCSPLRMATTTTTHLSVGELANMALSAVRLIDPLAPVAGHGLCSGAASANEEAESQALGGGVAGPQASRLFGSPVSLGHSWPASSGGAESGALAAQRHAATPSGMGVDQRRWLCRDDIPMLERRVYQAHCERKLWALGSSLNCTDIWIEGVRAADFARGVERLVEALMSHRLWEEAYRLANLSGVYDECRVLTEWVKDLLEQRRHVEAAHAGGYLAFHSDDGTEDDEEGLEEMRHQWRQLIRCCQESSTLRNQFRGFCLVVSAALTFDYGATLPMLRAGHCETDVYTSLVTLIEVIEHYRREERRLHHRGDATADGAAEIEEEGSPHDDTREGVDEASQAFVVGWLVWQDAVQIACALLRGGTTYEITPSVHIKLGHPTNRDGAADEISLEGFTAGVFDPLARYSKELLSTPTLASVTRAHPSLSEAKTLAQQFLDAFAAMH